MKIARAVESALGMRNEEQVHTRDGAVILGAHRRTDGRRFLKSHFSAHLRYKAGKENICFLKSTKDKYRTLIDGLCEFGQTFVVVKNISSEIWLSKIRIGE